MTEAPDEFLWLEEIEGVDALAWVAAQNARTLARFGGPAVDADADALAAIYDRPDNIPYPARRGGFLYNVWKDAQNPRGLWRRTTLDSFRTDDPAWETMLDLDALAAADGMDWTWGGADLLHDSHDRAILRLSRGGSDAATLREFDFSTKAFVEDGFALPEAKGGVAWVDRDTLLLSSAIGHNAATRSGYARTVRLWRRGADPLSAPVLFETAADSMAVWGGIDREGTEYPFVFVDRFGFFDTRVWLGDPSGARVELAVPTDSWSWFHRGWFSVRLRTDWNVGSATYRAGSLLGIALGAFLAGSRDFATLFAPSERRALTGFFWTGGRLVASILDDLRPEAVVFTPQESGWTSAAVPGLPAIGVADVMALDRDELDSDGTLLLTTQDPLTPPTLSLTDTSLAAPTVLKRAPKTFGTAGLVVTRHEAVSSDGTRIPYVQTGPAGETGEAPVHLYGYGGFNVSQMPNYRSHIGKLWLERGGTAVTANLRGGGEFGPAWHNAGMRAGKSLSHDDFAAVAADLVQRGVTRPDRIAAEGGSNGGLLITNMLTRYPDRFGGLFCTIPLIDMRRFHKLLAGASWIDEYGDPDKPEDWAFMRNFSAYQNVVAGKNYPPILLATTRRDDRVHPGHARKMTAKLEQLGHLAWLYELEGGGHGYGRTNRERAFFVALGLGFLRDAIGWRRDPTADRTS